MWLTPIKQAQGLTKLGLSLLWTWKNTGGRQRKDWCALHCTISKWAHRIATEQVTENIALKWQYMRRLRNPCLDIYISTELNRFRTEFTWTKMFWTRATILKPGIIRTSLPSTRLGVDECCSGSAWWWGQWLTCG